MHCLPRSSKLFGNGELNRLIALRRAEKPLASSDVADSIVEAKGDGRESIHALTRRLRANLSYLLRGKRVVKTGGPADGAVVVAERLISSTS
jgi:hypothetical protein